MDPQYSAYSSCTILEFGLPNPWYSVRMARASSLRPLAIRHRGDSGLRRAKIKAKIGGMTCKANYSKLAGVIRLYLTGNRHEQGEVDQEHAKSIHKENVFPPSTPIMSRPPRRPRQKG